jgi:nucleotide-binding universal stress UspA family protein
MIPRVNSIVVAPDFLASSSRFAHKRSGMEKFFTNQEKDMSQFKKILVPVDFSEQSVNALEYAYSLARRTRAEMIVLHVVRESTHFAPSVPPVAGWSNFFEEPIRLPLDLQLREGALDLSNFLENRAPKSWQVRISKRVRLGKPIKEVAATAREEKADLIVLGLRRRFFFAPFVNGQLLKLIERLSTPVLLAPAKTRPEHNQGEPDYARYPFGEEWLSDSAVSFDRKL